MTPAGLPDKGSADGRLLSLDVARGLAVAAMIFVNAPGPAGSYTFMQHMPWHGWTPADLIFPTFLFILGTSIPFAYGRRRERGEARRALAWRAARRAALLIALGLPFGYPVAPGDAFRIPGVLQRIGVCYLIGALLFLRLRTRDLALAAAVMLAAYWLLLTAVPVPGYGPGDLSPGGNLAFYVDRMVLGPHRLPGSYDAEGLLSTIPAAATTAIGVLSGIWLRSNRSMNAKAAWLAAAGACGVVLGLSWGDLLPLNKPIYTSSFALFACGAAAGLLSALYWLVDVRSVRAWTAPFAALGRHALVVYCAASLGEAVLRLVQVAAPGGGTQSLRLALLARLFSGLDIENAALAWASSWTALWLAAVTGAEAWWRSRSGA